MAPPPGYRAARTGADVVAGTRACRVMFAVLDGHYLITDLMRVTGLGRSCVHKGLVELRALGLVEWVDGTQGTVHPVAALVGAP